MYGTKRIGIIVNKHIKKQRKKAKPKIDPNFEPTRQMYFVRFRPPHLTKYTALALCEFQIEE
jgi:hypothetical protein